MKFSDVLEQVISWLRHKERISYRALKTAFDLDDDYLEELKAELIQARKLAVDENRTHLVWCPSHQTSPIDTKPQAEPTVWQTERQAERRQLTVLFGDLLGTAARTANITPEQRLELRRQYDDACLEIIHRLDGYVAQRRADELLIYFGYPQAREDDASRAVQAGLAMIDAVHRLNRLTQNPQSALQMAIRLSLHTELAVVGTSGEPSEQEPETTGELIRVAQQLHDFAQQNTIVMSAATYRLVQDNFVCDDLGTQRLKGRAKRIQAYRAIRERDAQRPSEADTPARPNSMIGRQDEIKCLQDRWYQVRQGTSQVVLLSGEAGIGKSRLVRAIKDIVAQDTPILFECRCSPQHQHSAFYPVVNLLKRTLQFAQDDTPETQWHKLESTLDQYGLAAEPSRSRLANMLTLESPSDAPPLAPLTPQRERQQIFETIQTLLTAIADQQPVTLIIEDLHWIDASTLELLNLLVTQVPPARFMMILTCRPEFQIPWPQHDLITQLDLKRLSPVQIEPLVLQVTGGKALPEEVMQHLIAKTDGVPLFVEELTKMIIELGLVREHDGQYVLMGLLPAQTIPSTLQGSLMARLDQLTPGKAVAQLGATIGRTFSLELIRQTSSFPVADLELGLQQLVAAEILQQYGESPHTIFIFRHALLQDIAYQSLLRPARQRYHEHTAHILESNFLELVKTHPELLAHHLTEAGLSARAIPYWQRAAQQAIKRSAHVETIGHLTQGLALVTGLPDTAERAQSELAFQLMLGNTLVKVKGYGTPEVGQAYARSRELCQQIDDARQLARVLYGLWVFYLTRAEFQTALELAEEIQSLLASQDDEDSRLLSHNAMGSTLCFLGEFTRARDHLAQGMACEAPLPSRRPSPTDATVPHVASFAYTSWALWYLGYPDQALAASQEAERLARERRHPFALAVALFYASILHQLRREADLAYDRANAVITLASELEFAVWVAGGTLVRGWALMEQGHTAEGFEQIQQGLTAWNATGAELIRPSGLAKLAEAYDIQGKPEQGLQAIEDALTAVNETGMRYYEAELYRLKGRLLLASSTAESQVTEAAEAYYRQAIDIAQRQASKSLQLRAATHLSQLWCQQGKSELAQELLKPIYNWFSEGFNTADLQEAKALMDSF